MKKAILNRKQVEVDVYLDPLMQQWYNQLLSFMPATMILGERPDVEIPITTSSGEHNDSTCLSNTDE